MLVECVHLIFLMQKSKLCDFGFVLQVSEYFVFVISAGFQTVCVVVVIKVIELAGKVDIF